MESRRAKRPIRAAGRPRKPPGTPTHRPVSEQIRYTDASNCHHAVQFADRVLNQPLNLHITIHWRFAPSPVPDADRVHQLVNVMAGWLRRRTGSPAVWVYARENGTARSLDGMHLHLMVHVPGGRDGGMGKAFLSALTGWVASSATDYEDRAVKAVWVWDKGIIGYLLKEGCDQAHQAFEVLPKHRAKRNGHPVPGKRVGICRSIDATARERYKDASVEPREASGAPTMSFALPDREGDALPSVTRKTALTAIRPF